MLLGQTVYNALHETKFVNLNTSQNKSQKIPTQQRPNSAYNTFIKYNTQKEKSPIYTHIFTDPEAILKSHMKERVKHTQQTEEDLLNLSRTTLKRIDSTSQVSKFFQENGNKSTNLFPMVDSSKSDVKDDFQTKIIRFVLAKRIYKESDMDMFLKQLVHKNKNYMSEEDIKEVFNHVKEELEK